MTAASSFSVQHEIETPLPLRAERGRLHLEGWCVSNTQSTPPKLRLVSADQIFTVSATTARVDVTQALGLEPTAVKCGFIIEGKLPPGVHLVTLQASNDFQPWQVIRQFPIVATPAELQAAVEWPALSTVHESVRLQGWCVHPDFTISEVWLHYGNRRVKCDYGLPRIDVPNLFPYAPNAARAGFIAVKNLPAGCGPMRIRAVTSTGESVFAFPAVTIDINRDEENPEPLDLHGSFPHLGPARKKIPQSPLVTEPRGRCHRVLFVLYGDFTSNSALHITNLANGLIALGNECVVAVPHNVETIRYHPEARFRAVSFDECLKNPAVFREGGTADVVHAWTTRENVRKFCELFVANCGSQLVVHLEDHELRILESNTGRSVSQLLTLPPEELDAIVPVTLSHPHYSRTFLQSACAITVIIDRLRELVPPGKPTHLSWPAADETSFFSRPIPWDMRRALGWGENCTVLFYHGNVHPTNQAEVRELYAAVLLLNETGIPAKLIRTGRDFCDFLGELGAKVASHVHALGQVDHQHHLPPLMALADFFVQPGAPDDFNDFRFPSKLPEFFALGRPVILPRTNLGGILRHGEDAWILPKADAASIAEAICLLRNDSDLRERLTAGASAVAARYFNWGRSASDLLAFYNSLPSHA